MYNKKLYCYFISYTFSDGSPVFGFGNQEIFTDKKILCYDQLDEIAKDIKKENNFLKVIILNYQLMVFNINKPHYKKERKR